jgi:rubredoxin
MTDLLSLIGFPKCPLCHSRRRKQQMTGPYAGRLRCKECGIVYRPRGQGVRN